MTDGPDLEEMETHLKSLLFNEEGYLDRRLKLASFYLLAYEALRRAVIDPLQSFYFADEFWKEAVPDAHASREKYKKMLKGKRKFEASRDWLLQSNAISEDDSKFIEGFISIRGDVAHNLAELLWSPDRDHLSEHMVFAALCRVHKVENWWFQNFEMAIDDELAKSFSQEEKDGAASVATGYLFQLFDAAFPDFREAVKQ